IRSALRESSPRDAPLHAVVDLRWMRPGMAGGIENLSRSFLDHLLRLDGFNRYTVLVPAETRYDFDVRAAATSASPRPTAHARTRERRRWPSSTCFTAASGCSGGARPRWRRCGAPGPTGRRLRCR